MSDQESAIILQPQQAVAHVQNSVAIVNGLRNATFQDGHHYGTIPGTPKPTLLKPGAEHLCAAFHLQPQMTIEHQIEQWEDDNPLFHYTVSCTLIHIDTGLKVASAHGSCNSKEGRYRWRWEKADNLPEGYDTTGLKSRSSSISEFAFAVEKKETGGQYGKPQAYWDNFQAAIDNGTARATKRKTRKGSEMDAWEINKVEYRVPNDDIFALVNTVLKMAEKRALVAATLIATGASDFFTQDIEDNPAIVGADDFEFVPTASEREKHHIDGDPGMDETVVEPLGAEVIEGGKGVIAPLSFVPKDINALYGWYIKELHPDITPGEAQEELADLLGFDITDEDAWAAEKFRNNRHALKVIRGLYAEKQGQEDEQGDF